MLSRGDDDRDYPYDGDGYRVQKVVGATTTTYAWDRLGAGGLGAVVGDGTGEYVFGPAGLQQRTVGAASQYAQGDGLGSVRLITDGSGAAAGTATFEPWGAPKGGSASLGGFGFTGEQTDAETGFVYLRARNYDPATGRFVQQDGYSGSPGNPQGQHRFAYVGNNPVRFADPSGHEAIEGGDLTNTRRECAERGYDPSYCASADPGDLMGVMGDTGGTLIDPTDPESAWQDGSWIDRGICILSLAGPGKFRAGGSAIMRSFERQLASGGRKSLEKSLVHGRGSWYRDVVG
jgi:RHS repeat-associated protein